MTIAIAYALREEPESVGFWLAADARLTLDRTLSVTDTFVKTIDLVDGVAMVIAGGTLPSTAAAELIRPLVNGHNRTPGQERVSFYDICRSFAYFARRIYLESGSETESDAVLCGFYRDGSPGLAHFRLKAGVAHFYKPPRGGRCGVVIGDVTLRPLVELAISRARARGNGFDGVMSLLYTIIKHGGKPYRSVGGGIAFGYCEGPDQPVQWPTVEIDDEIFLRGIHVNQFMQTSWKTPFKVALNQDFATDIERELDELNGASPARLLDDRPRASWPIDGARVEDLFKFTSDPFPLQVD